MIVLIMDEMFASFPIELDRQFSSIEKAREALLDIESKGYTIDGIRAYDITLSPDEKYIVSDDGFGEHIRFEKREPNFLSTKEKVDLGFPITSPMKLKRGTKVMYYGQEMEVIAQSTDLEDTVCGYHSTISYVPQKITVKTKKLVKK